MRLVTLLFFLLLSFSVAYGQTSEEQVSFVDEALNRISNRITDLEASLTDQIELARREEESLRQQIEDIVVARTKTEQEAAYIAQRLQVNEKGVHTSAAYNQAQERTIMLGQIESELKHKEESSRTMAYAEQEKYIGLDTELRKAIARDAANMAKLNMLNKAWRAKTGDKEFEKLVDAIKVTAGELALKASVNITSHNATGTNTTGARVRFQGDDERRHGIPPKYSGLTNCTEQNLDIGWYYFWTERSGKETSEKNYGKFIVQPLEKIQLVEDR